MLHLLGSVPKEYVFSYQEDNIVQAREFLQYNSTSLTLFCLTFNQSFCDLDFY